MKKKAKTALSDRQLHNAKLAYSQSQNKSGFFGGPAFFPANQSNLKILKKL